MAKRRMAIIAVLLCFCCLLPVFRVMALSTTDAKEPININKECSLTVSFIYGETIFQNVNVKLYKVADVSNDFQYTLTPDFTASELVLNGIKTNSEWNVVCATLEAYIVANGINPHIINVTDAKGKVYFENLKPALYLVIVGNVTQNEIICNFDSALISLPNLNADGFWQYQVNVNTKSEIVTPTEKEIEYKVIKLWKGDLDKNVRPKNIEIEIFKDGISFNKATLSKDNNWAYSWQAKDDGTTWTVIEKNVPSGYKMTVENRDNTFIVTNTYPTPDTPVKPPHTGDTSNVMLYSIIIFLTGSLLLILGVVGKRNSDEEN